MDYFAPLDISSGVKFWINLCIYGNFCKYILGEEILGMFNLTVKREKLVPFPRRGNCKTKDL